MTSEPHKAPTFPLGMGPAPLQPVDAPPASLKAKQCPFVQADADDPPERGVSRGSFWSCQANVHEVGPDGQDGHELPSNGAHGTGRWIDTSPPAPIEHGDL